MKKQVKFLLGLTAVVCLGFMTSCSKDEDEVKKIAPSLLVTPSATSISKGTAVYFVIDSREGDAKLSKITVKLNAQFVTDAKDKVWDGSTSISSPYADTVFISGATFANNNDYDFEFIVTDKDGLTASKTIKVVVADPVTSGEINSYTTVLIGGQDNSTEGSAYSSSTNVVYSIADANANSNKVDFVYYYGAANNSTFAAPNDVTVIGGTNNLDLCSAYSVKNATTFKSTNVSVSDFDAMTNDAKIVEAVTTAPTSSKVINLAVNNVIAFKTAAGKYGLIKVSIISGTASGSITIDVKVQK